MKVKQLINVLGALNDTGKLACDMYSLDESEYYSQSQGAIAISEMEFSHVLRAFRKICDEDVRIDTQEGKVKDMVSKEAYQVMWDNCEKLEKQVNHWKKLAEANFISSVNDSETSDIWKERYEKEVDNAEYWRKAYNDASSLQGCYYTFSEVPQDAEGNAFIKNCRKYLNRDSYKIRVKGQHLKPELYGKGRAYHGANMEDSTHMRVYIDTK